MKIEEKFNRKHAKLVEVQFPSILTGGGLAEGIKLTFDRTVNDPDPSRISMHMTPDEALLLAQLLISAARSRLSA